MKLNIKNNQNWYEKYNESQTIISSLNAEILYLKEQLNLLRSKHFGVSSEKSKFLTDGSEQLTLFNEAEHESNLTAQEPKLEEITYKRKKQKGKRELDFSGLPIETVIYELPENERNCLDCNRPLHLCGRDLIRRELVVIPAEFKVREHMGEVWSCRHCEHNSVRVPMTKTMPPAPVIKGSGIASPSLLAYIANQKYTLALPLYRQEQEFKRLGLNISRQNMANWLIYTAERYIKPVWNAMKNILLSQSVLHADETSVQVLKEEGKTAQSKSYVWMYRTGCDTNRPIVLYEYQPNRQHKNAKSFLENFAGFLHSDGYQAYDNLSKNVTVVGCWAHVRRKLADILKSIPDYNKPGSLAMHGVKFCDALFELEREYAKFSSENDFKARFDARLKKSKLVIDEFFDWAESVYGKNIMATPQSNMGKTLAYALNQRSHLENVLLDGRLELSNNRAERSIKPFVIGRKNWLFSDTEKGAKASAMFYSIIETAKESGLNLFEYLNFIFETAPNLAFENNPDLINILLPWNAFEKFETVIV